MCDLTLFGFCALLCVLFSVQQPLLRAVSENRKMDHETEF